MRARILFAGACAMAAFAFLSLLLPPRKAVQASASASGPSYAANGDMLPPANYREWTYVTSGVDMSYSPKVDMAGHSMFDNVFVNPEAYRSFRKTGTWPDKTVMVLESRMAQSKGSINQRGHFQDKDVMAIEVHVKDEARFPAKWAFFEFDSIDKNGTLVPSGAPCYTCHAAHGAVDTTFVQFYPTLLPIAQAKKTLSDAFLKEEAASAK